MLLKNGQTSLCEKCPNTEFFLVRITKYLDTFHALKVLQCSSWRYDEHDTFEHGNISNLICLLSLTTSQPVNVF